MKIEAPVNQVPSESSVNKEVLMNVVLSAAFYPNYFCKAYNPEREKDAYR